MDAEEFKQKAALLAVKRGGEVHFGAPPANPPTTPVRGAAAPDTKDGTTQVTIVRGAGLTDEVRGVLAIWAVSLMTVLLVVPLLAFSLGKVSITDLSSIFQAVFAGTAGIIGAVLGFYFSSQQAKAAPAPAAPPG